MKFRTQIVLVAALFLAVLTPTWADKLPKPSSPVQVIKYIQVDASLRDTWNLVGNHELLPSYAPMIESVDIDKSQAKRDGQTGVIRQCNVAGMGPAKERIVSYDAPYSFSYSAFVNPMGMTNHLATLELIKLEDKKTLIVWKQHFNHPQPAMIASQLDGMLGILENGIKQQLAAR